MKLKKILSLGLAFVLTASLAACGSGNPAPSTNTGGGTETTAAGSDAGAGSGEVAAQGESGVLYSNGGPSEFFETPWLNPGTYMYNKVLYGHLLWADENLSPVSGEGDLAKSYEMSEDGKTLTFELRDGITWHDGEAITGEEIQWNIEYALKSTVLNSVFRSTFEAIEGAEAYINGEADSISGITVDGNKVVLTFAKVAISTEDASSVRRSARPKSPN